MSGAVLVTGGAGSVGRMLVEKLVADGQPVRIFDLPFMDFDGLEDRDGIEIVKGDITDAAQVADALKGVNSVVHLAALLPPNSERDRDRTFGVNVGGTENIIKAMEAGAQDATLIFTSSISTYGNTMDEKPPVRVSHSQSAIDIYADSKIVGERMVRESSLNWIAMRIAGIMVPAFMEPPNPWPFVAEQRVEMVHRDDVVDALFASVKAHPKPQTRCSISRAGRHGSCAVRTMCAISTTSWERRLRMWTTASRRAGWTGTTPKNRSVCCSIRTGLISTTRMRCTL